MADVPYRYTNLTAAVADKRSPLRQHFDQKFPNLKPLQAEYRASAGPLLVDGGGANPGTVGAAFDFLARFTLNPSHTPHVAFHAAAGSPGATAALDSVRQVAEDAAGGARSSDAPEPLLRASWALALATEVYRRGLTPGSPLALLASRGEFTGPNLLALAPDDALEQLQALQRVARERFYPTVRPDATLALGPTFDCSRLCSADADLIADGCLLDIKTHLGSKTKTGRSDLLNLADVYQLLGYALFDRNDSYRIHDVGIYSARYGHLVRWSLPHFLATLAGHPVDLKVERETVWALLLRGRP